MTAIVQASTIADHGARLTAVEKRVEGLESKLDRLQFWLMTTLAGVLASIAVQFLKK